MSAASGPMSAEARDPNPWQEMRFLPIRAVVHVRDAAGVVALTECRKVGTRLIFHEGALSGPPTGWRWPRA